MHDYKKYLINENKNVKQALVQLNSLATEGAIVFLVDKRDILIGSITDGDIRRGFIKGLDLNSSLRDFIQLNPIYLIQGENSPAKFKEYREHKIKIVPVLDAEKRIVDVINMEVHRSLLPLDALIMAGGEGKRLRPLTEKTPKPLLKIGDKPIIEYNVDRLVSYGIKNISISLNYLGEQIEAYFGNGFAKNFRVQYLWEKEPLGTIGSVALQTEWLHDYILIMNSDLLTNIDFEDIFNEMMIQEADMIVATVPYEVNIPYGVIEFDKKQISGVVEKPTYTYYSNAGIYIIKKELLPLIPKHQYYNATDLINELGKHSDKKVSNYPIYGYWLDIGKHQDFEKAQLDLHSIKF